jgi:hypothetical protein
MLMASAAKLVEAIAQRIAIDAIGRQVIMELLWWRWERVGKAHRK